MWPRILAPLDRRANRVPEVIAGMTCSSCGTENEAGRKFCKECAARLALTCPTCGAANSADAKFCGECAAPLAPPARQTPPTAAVPAPVAERRLVSVLFADLVGFTPFAAEHDAEEVRETLTRYFDLAADVIGRYGGTVEKFIGDAVMAVWGAPAAREDDAERAVRAGLELVDAVRALGPMIEARAGVLTGEAAVTLGATNQGLVAGDLVNTASRLQSVAPAGAVLVGEATWRAASRAIVFEPAGDQTLKGKVSPVPAWRAVRVVAQRGGRNRSDALEAPFVGRDEELRALKDLHAATGRERRPRLVSVIGPAGIGKTRLAWEFLKYLDGLVERVWWHAGRSPAYGDGVTFWALGEMVRGRAGLAEGDDEATTRTKVAETVRTHISDPAEAAWIEPALLALLGVETGIASDELFAAWRTFFERLAGTAPVVLVFEDLQHADPGLLDFIDHVMEWSRGVPITILTLARPELLDRRPGWGAGLRSFTSIHLEPLPPADMQRLLAGLVPGLPAATTTAIVARADGVPLYAVETVRMLLAQGRLVLEDGVCTPVGSLDEVAVPETLTALVAARLDGLDPADRALLSDAAVLGQSFSPGALAAVAGTGEAELEPRLRGLVRHELLTLDVDPRSPGRGQYAFVQALVREVAYHTLAKRDRRLRHLAAARYLESLGSEEVAGALADHYLAAYRNTPPGPEADALAAQARTALRSAAARATALGSHGQALAFLEQALEITTDPADRAALHAGAFAAAEEALGIAAMIRHAEAAVQERRRAGDREAIALAVAEQARAITWWLGDPESARTFASESWEEFSDLEQTPAGVALMQRVAWTYLNQDDAGGAMTWWDRLLPIAERLGLLEGTADGILGRGESLLRTGRPREGMVLLRGAHQLAIANDLRDAELGARVLLTYHEQWGEPAVGLALAREGLEIGRRRGSRRYGSWMVENGCICALRTGDWDWVAGLLDEWLALESATIVWAESFVDRAILRSLRGEDAAADIAEAARIRLEVAVSGNEFEPYGLWAGAWAAFAGGRPDEVRRLGERAAELMMASLAPLVCPLMARSALWAGDGPGAASALAILDASAHVGAALAADRLVVRAGIDALEGRGPAALAGYREALRAYRKLGLAFDEAAAAVDMAVLLPSPERDAPDVATAIAAARSTLERLGARPFLARLDATGSPPCCPRWTSSSPTAATTPSSSASTTASR
jgi:class 3 adenylate cyclase/predicted ATPase